MKLSHGWSRATPVFDDDTLVSCAGLVPVMALAEQTGLSTLITDKVVIKHSGVASAGVNPAGKLTSIIAGMAAGADSIDDLDLIRSGGMARCFDEVYACSTLGQFLREFTHGHGRQLASVARAHLVTLAHHTNLLPGLAQRAYVDIDSLLRPVYGHHKQGASYGHTKIAGKQILRKGLSPLVTTISTDQAAPVVAGIRLRAGKTGSGKNAASMVTETIRTAHAAGASGEILVRGDSAYGNHAVVGACVKTGARFSVVLTKNRTVTRAIAAIPPDAWTPVRYPGSVVDPDTGELISDAEVAEIRFTAFATTGRPITARLIVRRVRDRARTEELFPSGGITRSSPTAPNPAPTRTSPTASTAVIETTHADLIDGPLAHQPSGYFAANNAWTLCAAITHNLLRAVATLPGSRHARARGATIRRQLLTVPARLTRPHRRPTLHLPAHRPWAMPWNTLWEALFATRSPARA